MHRKIRNAFLLWVGELAEKFMFVVEHAGFTLTLLGHSSLFLNKAFEKRREILKQMYIAGVKSFVVVSIVAFFTGMILSLQSGIEMKKWGIQNLLGNLVIATLTREMAPLMTAVVLIASVGSAVAAEIAACIWRLRASSARASA